MRICWIAFTLSRNLDEVFTYKHTALMSLRRRSHVKVSVVLTGAYQSAFNQKAAYRITFYYLLVGVYTVKPGVKLSQTESV